MLFVVFVLAALQFTAPSESIMIMDYVTLAFFVFGTLYMRIFWSSNLI